MGLLRIGDVHRRGEARQATYLAMTLGGIFPRGLPHGVIKEESPCRPA